MSAVARTLAALLLLASTAHAADTITLATSRLIAYVAVPVMLERGLLAEQGIDAKLVTFDSAQPITLAVVSGDADFGVGGLSAAFYNLAGQGQLRILAAGTREMPGFQNFAVFVSRRAGGEGGLKSLKDLDGRTVGVTQFGTALEYSLGLVAEKYGFDVKTMRVMALQSNANLVAALVGNQLDGALMPGAVGAPALGRAEVIRLAWVADEMPGIQNSVAFVSARIADERPDLVRRFLVAYRKAAQLYHDAVTDEGEHRHDGPALQALLPALAKFASLSLDDARTNLPWIDGGARLDMADLRRQVDWYSGHGFMKSRIDLDMLVDQRYATLLPKK